MKKIFYILTCCLLLGLSSCSNNVSGDDVEDSKKTQNWNTYEITIEGALNTEDNPWGKTACIIESEGVGDCVFLTPNTSFTLYGLDQTSVISLQAELHPWVADASDGAGVDVWIMNDSDDIIHTDSLIIEKEDGWKNIQYSFAGIEGASKIKFLCNNGLADDDNADWLVFKTSTEYLSNFGENGYIRSATYFGDAWPINFWNSEFETLDKDFKQIKDDGFDSIILVIPWKEFQTSTDPIVYSDYAFNNLTIVMDKAQEYGLDVYARIGYTWDFYNDSEESITERYLDLLRKEETRRAWIDYCKTMYQKLSVYPNFKDGFLTWEDFWNNLQVCENNEEGIRLDYAKSIGYQDWVKDNFTLETYNANFSTNYKSYDDIPVPYKPLDASMEAFYRFFDDVQNDILRDTQQVFPNISIEVRLDWDTYVDNKGNMSYYPHTVTYKCENSDFTATMYGIPMGCENVGERISAEEAMEHTEYILANLLQNNNGKPVYIEQFLFMDNTPQFSYNAQIKDNEVGEYLENIVTVLDKYSKGYGIWTYRNYRNSLLYNSQFALGKLGWEVAGNPEFIELEEINSMVCRMKEGDSITQSIPEIRNHFNQENFKFSIDVVRCDVPSVISVKFGSESNKLKISSEGKYELSFKKNDNFDLEMVVEAGDLYVDNLCLYSFIQEGNLYDVDGNELRYILQIRNLNSKLQ